MNKRQWFATTDTQAMLRFLAERASDRKLRLFGVACCRRVWPAVAGDELCRRAVEAAERLADGTGTVRECRVARAAVDEGPWGPNSDIRLRSTRYMAREVTRLAAGAAALETASAALRLAGAPASNRYEGVATSQAEREAARAEAARQITSIRCIFGNPFRPFPVDPAWLTSDVLALARGMYESRDFSATPILADALQDAGCNNDDALTHLRSSGDHARGCWVLDAVLGKS